MIYNLRSRTANEAVPQKLSTRTGRKTLIAQLGRTEQNHQYPREPYIRKSGLHPEEFGYLLPRVPPPLPFQDL